MPADKVSFYNRIDIGIFTCFTPVQWSTDATEGDWNAGDHIRKRKRTASEGLQGRTLPVNAWRKIVFFAGERGNRDP